MPKLTLKIRRLVPLLIGIAILPAILWAAGSQYYQSYSDSTLRVITSNAGTRYGVTSNTNNYFIPNNTAAEWNAFYFKASAGQISGLSICTTTDGGWSGYGGWYDTSSCSVSCGGGTKTQRRDRACNNPSLSCGGSTCSGSSFETQSVSCNAQSCPVICSLGGNAYNGSSFSTEPECLGYCRDAAPRGPNQGYYCNDFQDPEDCCPDNAGFCCCSGSYYEPDYYCPYGSLTGSTCMGTCAQ